MWYLEQARYRFMILAATTIATVTLLIETVHGINAVGVIFAAAIINILVYYALPDSHVNACPQKQKNHFQAADFEGG